MLRGAPSTRITCDVVVVGGGNAGLAAAIEARNGGADVLLIEKGPRATRGGNSRFTYGDFRVITNGTSDIRALLSPDHLPDEAFEIEPLSAEFFYGEAMRLSEGLADKRLTHMFVDRSMETVGWLKTQGVQWTLNPSLAFRKEGRLFYPVGNANIQAVGGGKGLVEMLYAIAQKKGVAITYDASAYELVTRGDGAMAGLLAKTPDGITEVVASSVILCCGGFQASTEKRRAYLGENMDLVKVRGTRYNTGDWLPMTQAVGAQFVGHWGGCHASPISRDFSMVEGSEVHAPRYSFPYSIMVNRTGKRFVDEGENFYCWTYNRYGKDILRQPGSVAFQIFDAKVEKLIGYEKGEHVEDATLEGLARKLDIDVAGLIGTVEQFNAAIANDSAPFVEYDLDHRHTQGLNPDKTNWAQRVDSPPFHGYAVICGLTMTYGGVKTNERAEVIDTSDRPIDGLYAVGELTGGYFYHTYLGGSGLIRGTVMGRVAGSEAAARVKSARKGGTMS